MSALDGQSRLRFRYELYGKSLDKPVVQQIPSQSSDDVAAASIRILQDENYYATMLLNDVVIAHRQIKTFPDKMYLKHELIMHTLFHERGDKVIRDEGHPEGLAGKTPDFVHYDEPSGLKVMPDLKTTVFGRDRDQSMKMYNTEKDKYLRKMSSACGNRSGEYDFGIIMFTETHIISDYSVRRISPEGGTMNTWPGLSSLKGLINKFYIESSPLRFKYDEENEETATFSKLVLNSVKDIKDYVMPESFFRPSSLIEGKIPTVEGYNFLKSLVGVRGHEEEIYKTLHEEAISLLNNNVKESKMTDAFIERIKETNASLSTKEHKKQLTKMPMLIRSPLFNQEMSSEEIYDMLDSKERLEGSVGRSMRRAVGSSMNLDSLVRPDMIRLNALSEQTKRYVIDLSSEDKIKKSIEDATIDVQGMRHLYVYTLPKSRDLSEMMTSVALRTKEQINEARLAHTEETVEVMEEKSHSTSFLLSTETGDVDDTLVLLDSSQNATVAIPEYVDEVRPLIYGTVTGVEKPFVDRTLNLLGTQYSWSSYISACVSKEIIVSLKAYCDSRDQWLIRKVPSLPIILLIHHYGPGSVIHAQMFWRNSDFLDLKTSPVFIGEKYSHSRVFSFSGIFLDTLLNAHTRLVVNHLALIQTVGLTSEEYEKGLGEQKQLDWVQRMTSVSYLLMMEGRRETSTNLLNLRYMYMHIFSMTKTGLTGCNPFKFMLKKMTLNPRGRVLVWVLNRLIDRFKAMTQSLPYLSPGSSLVREDMSDDTQYEKSVKQTSGDEVTGCKSILTDTDLFSFRQVLYESYIPHISFPQASQNKTMAQEQIVKKTMTVEMLTMKEMKERELLNEREREQKRPLTPMKYGHVLSNGKPDTTGYDPLFMANALRHQEERMQRRMGNGFRAVIDKAIMKMLHKSDVNHLSSSKRSATIRKDSQKVDYCEGSDNVAASLLDAVGTRGMSPSIYDDLGDILEEVMMREGLYCRLFDKVQFGGVREIFVLDVLERILQHFIESVADCISGCIPEEFMSKGEIKKRMMASAIAVEQDMAKGVSAEGTVFKIRASADATNWCQYQSMNLMCYCLMWFTDPKWHNLIMQICKVFMERKIRIPKKLKAVIEKKTGTRPMSPEIIALIEDREREPHERMHISECGNFMFVRFGFPQGINGKMSSLVHVISKNYLTYLASVRITKSFPKNHVTVTTRQFVTSDDSLVMLMLTSPNKPDSLSGFELNENEKDMSMYDAMSFAGAYFMAIMSVGMTRFSALDSIKSAYGPIAEFNSLWILNTNSVISPLVKTANRTCMISGGTSLGERVLNAYSSLTAYRQDGATAETCFMTQVMQVVTHYEMLGLSNHPLFYNYKTNLLYCSSRNLGYFVMSRLPAAGLLPYEYSLRHWLTKSQAIANGMELDMREPTTAVVGGVTKSKVKVTAITKLTSDIRQLSKLERLYKVVATRLGLRDDFRDEANSNFENLFRKIKSVSLTVVKLMQACINAIVEKDLTQTDYAVMTVYIHHKPVMCFRSEKIGREFHYEHMSLRQASIRAASIIKEAPLGVEILLGMFPAHEVYSSIDNLLPNSLPVQRSLLPRGVQPRSIMSETHTSRVGIVDIMSLVEVASVLWVPEGHSEHKTRTAKSALLSYQQVAPWFRDNYLDTAREMGLEGMPYDVYKTLLSQRDKRINVKVTSSTKLTGKTFLDAIEKMFGSLFVRHRSVGSVKKEDIGASRRATTGIRRIIRKLQLVLTFPDVSESETMSNLLQRAVEHHVGDGLDLNNRDLKYVLNNPTGLTQQEILVSCMVAQMRGEEGGNRSLADKTMESNKLNMMFPLKKLELVPYLKRGTGKDMSESEIRLLEQAREYYYNAKQNMGENSRDPCLMEMRYQGIIMEAIVFGNVLYGVSAKLDNINDLRKIILSDNFKYFLHKRGIDRLSKPRKVVNHVNGVREHIRSESSKLIRLMSTDPDCAWFRDFSTEDFMVDEDSTVRITIEKGAYKTKFYSRIELVRNDQQISVMLDGYNAYNVDPVRCESKPENDTGDWVYFNDGNLYYELASIWLNQTEVTGNKIDEICRSLSSLQSSMGQVLRVWFFKAIVSKFSNSSILTVALGEVGDQHLPDTFMEDRIYRVNKRVHTVVNADDEGLDVYQYGSPAARFTTENLYSDLLTNGKSSKERIDLSTGYEDDEYDEDIDYSRFDDEEEGDDTHLEMGSVQGTVSDVFTKVLSRDGTVAMSSNGDHFNTYRLEGHDDQDVNNISFPISSELFAESVRATGTYMNEDIMVYETVTNRFPLTKIFENMRVATKSIIKSLLDERRSLGSSLIQRKSSYRVEEDPNGWVIVFGMYYSDDEE